ncbi:MAG: thiamine pyrophosphate-dependent enzyme [Methanotrichaceae archaeon]
MKGVESDKKKGMNSNGRDCIDSVKLAVDNVSVETITYVPGYPITELAEALEAEISVNEKVALEICLGASATGMRSMVIVKQVGMNLLSDPMVISATHTIGAGAVILVGDDLGPKGSQVEMDSRYLGPVAELPVLDPRDAETLYSSILEAYALSERLRVPVIIRVTQRVLISGTHVKAAASEASGQIFDRSIWDITARGRHQRHHSEILHLAEAASESSSLNRMRISDDIGIIASGYPAMLSQDFDRSLLAVGYAYPLSWKLIRDFIDAHRIVLVAEEPEPFIESQLRMSPKVRGRLTHHLPFGPLEKNDIQKALETADQKITFNSSNYESAAERGYMGVCDDCPFASLFRALGRLDVPVAGDAGCAIRATREPYKSVDVVYGLGSSIGVASGFKKKGVAVIGDFALAHSGIQGLINAIWHRRELLMVLLKNDIAATTGGQRVPDLTKLLEVIVPTVRLELPCSDELIERVLREELKRTGTSAVVALSVCPKYRLD